jgi:DNA modification methylase
LVKSSYPDKWEECFNQNWKGAIVDDHPAKFARGVIQKMYVHAFKNSWIKKNSRVIDPFGGIALGALGAMSRDVHWTGVELEEKFANIGKQNILLWEKILKKKNLAVLINGDSMRLKEYVNGKVDLCISSPPYESSASGHGDYGIAGRDKLAGKKVINFQYAESSSNNLGNKKGDSFWNGAKCILEQCYELLKPGGHAIWNTKDYVRKRRRVPFSDMWLALCEDIGFILVCSHRVTMIRGVQRTIDEENKVMQRKSFYRRLVEKQGAPKIDWEDIFCMKKEV